jgi:phosphoadenosine phosphosulfate reductase
MDNKKMNYSSEASSIEGGNSAAKKSIKIRFTEERTKDCENLMRPEIRPLLDLTLDEKIAKSKEIIKEALSKYPKLGLGFSGGTDSLVLLHLALPIIPADAPIVFVNTHYEFPEAIEFIKKVIKEWGIKNFIEVKAEQAKLQDFINKFGFKTPEFTTVCCEYHKIAPMMKVIGDLELNAFFVGLRGVEHEERAKEIFFSPRKNPDHIRVHPLLFWRKRDVLEYVKKNNIECNLFIAKDILLWAVRFVRKRILTRICMKELAGAKSEKKL